jgi:glutamate N-acetyltransferase/amino-acid N-acetyltransferase
MKTITEFIPSGGVTSPKGFSAGAVSAGIKNGGGERLDLAILLSETVCNAAAVFTRNRVKAAPVVLTQERLQRGRAAAVIVNSGCANACTGEDGLKHAAEMAEMAARHVGVSPSDVLVASTGVIGYCLPLNRIRDAVAGITCSIEGGHDLALAIMTTDTVPKEAAVAVSEGGFIIGGTAKGSGMIHPDMATLLCFLTTDAAVEAAFLNKALQGAIDASFNMVSVDGDTSTNDMALIMANGRSGGEPITEESSLAGVFQEALNDLCVHLAREIARDGEGATKLIEVTVKGAASLADARLIARTIVSSPLVKTAVHGSDPNWGRVITAAGYSGAGLDAGKLELKIGGIQLVKNGCPVDFKHTDVVKILDGNEVSIVLDLNLGNAEAVAWGCDMSEEYVTINSEYTT